jgi:hypothetical protein
MATVTNLATIRKGRPSPIYPKGWNRTLSLGTSSKKYRGPSIIIRGTISGVGRGTLEQRK